MKIILQTNASSTAFLIADEITAAEYLLIKEHYRESELALKALDLNAINAHRTAEGLIRCPNRLDNTDSPSISAAPILLLAHHPLTAMIIMHHHVVNIHCGVHATIAQLRRTFYIPSIRSTVAQTLKSCMISTFCANRKITWKFITPLSPWKGGFYERLVGLFKSAYRKAVRRDLLPLQQLQTLVTEIEAVLNSRPLTSYRDISNAPHILKPIDFISPEVQLQLPPLDNSAPNVSNHNLGDWYKETIKVLDRFWEIWYRDYLSAIAERHQSRIRQGRSSPRTPQVSDVVLVADKNVPRGQWHLGVITEVRSDKNGIPRSAVVRMSNGKLLSRSLNHLYPLEITAADQSTRPQRRTSLSPTRVQPPRAVKRVRSYSH
ncbi:hypothetical protein OESDEN_14127 [Oesophagostomum dentatum]|uniref:DUF5641 domain-containing protein n=1 Tax=Oesophagostomum dentatum TaxID=61180 RepID=A0A0B1SRN1_OESDE|nr:hypothetical protein OESDEN_14127 [Oesophagostomum dentatum]